MLTDGLENWMVARSEWPNRIIITYTSLLANPSNIQVITIGSCKFPTRDRVYISVGAGNRDTCLQITNLGQELIESKSHDYIFENTSKRFTLGKPGYSANPNVKCLLEWDYTRPSSMPYNERQLNELRFRCIEDSLNVLKKLEPSIQKIMINYVILSDAFSIFKRAKLISCAADTKESIFHILPKELIPIIIRKLFTENIFR